MTTPAQAASYGGHAYFSVQLHLLHACNLSCAHCYDANHSGGEMPALPEIKRRLDAIFAFGASEGFLPDIHLSGGEPTLRKDLVEIVEYIIGTKGGDALLFTNGTRMNRALARDLYLVGLRFIQVSLEGPKPHTDGIRGQGVFDTAMATLRMLKGMGFRLTVSTTVTASNYPYLQRFVEELDDLGLHFHLREVFPVGAGSALLQITREQRREFHRWAIAHEGASTVGVEDPVHCSADAGFAKNRAGCVAGRNHFSVDVDGSIYPCRPLAHRVGHVNYLRAAWYSPDMVRIRKRAFGGQCGHCELTQNCGGCRVHALLAGDLFGEDPRCFAAETGMLRPQEVGTC
ncbi:radical SAM/SPASM domain-containing protein [Geothrix sp. 21YS21S-2]|uniref:radical SAM/SPASM domain-containing protein n=1 Tax=Geothrix sp. 21YS21S-2 TaxID=3068893 RepID=UPI0027B92008|nr:radical SAM protein [Geothrix sp. 21YS21S-2]